jgi:hypothetical protein
LPTQADVRDWLVLAGTGRFKRSVQSAAPSASSPSEEKSASSPSPGAPSRLTDETGRRASRAAAAEAALQTATATATNHEFPLGRAIAELEQTPR